MKFVGTRDPKAERMGILGIQFYGYEKTLDEMQESETWVCVCKQFLYLKTVLHCYPASVRLWSPSLSFPFTSTN